MPLNRKPVIEKIRQLHGSGSSSGGEEGGNFDYDSHPRTQKLITEIKDIITKNFTPWNDRILDANTANGEIRKVEDGVETIRNIFKNKTSWYNYNPETIGKLREGIEAVNKIIGDGEWMLSEKEKSEIAKIGKHIEQLEKDLEETKKKHKATIKERNDLQQKLIDTARGMGEDKNELLEFYIELEEKNKEIDRLQEEIDDERKKKENVERDSRRVQEDLERKLEELRRERENQRTDDVPNEDEEKVEQLLKSGHYEWKRKRDESNKLFLSISSRGLRTDKRWYNYYHHVKFIFELMQELDNKDKRIEKLGQDIVDLERARNDLDMEKQRHMREIGELRTKVSEKTTEIGRLERRIETLEEDVKAVDRKAAGKEDEIRELNAEIRKLKLGTGEGDTTDYKSKYNETKQQLENLEREYNHLAEIQKNASYDLGGKESTIQEKDKEIKYWQDQVEEKRKEGEKLVKKAQDDSKIEEGKLLKDAQEWMDKYKNLIKKIRSNSEMIFRVEKIEWKLNSFVGHSVDVSGTTDSGFTVSKYINYRDSSETEFTWNEGSDKGYVTRKIEKKLNKSTDESPYSTNSTVKVRFSGTVRKIFVFAYKKTFDMNEVGDPDVSGINCNFDVPGELSGYTTLYDPAYHI